MSMLTRCPECGTSFRITTDQLVSRQGKVRCGRCQHVFSALSSLVHTRDPVAHPPSGPVAPLDANSSMVIDTLSRPLEEEITLRPLAAEGEYDASDLAPVDPGHETSPFTRPPRELVQGENSALTQEVVDYPARGKRRTSVLSLAGVLLALLALAGQGAYFYRNQLALWQPDAKPWLALMCAKLDCRIETPMDPQAISIESSSLEADPGDRDLLQLNALLRNRSSLPQKLPYLELTLIDAQEAPLARRIIKPDEYGLRGGASAPAPLGADGEYQIRLSVDASQVKANGYRLYAFYP